MCHPFRPTKMLEKKKTGKQPGVARQKLPDAEQRGCPGQTQERTKLKRKEHPGTVPVLEINIFTKKAEIHSQTFSQ